MPRRSKEMNGSSANNNNNSRSTKKEDFRRYRSRRSHSSLETSGGGDSRVNREEIRSVLVRHWTSLDRARLHTFHLWLFVYSLAQIFLFHYLCHRVSKL